MVSIFFALIVLAAVVYFAMHLHRVYLKGYSRRYLVYLKDDKGALTCGSRIYNRLKKAGVVERTVLL